MILNNTDYIYMCVCVVCVFVCVCVFTGHFRTSKILDKINFLAGFNRF